jgi:hypothetical protein
MDMEIGRLGIEIWVRKTRENIIKLIFSKVLDIGENYMIVETY